MLRSVASKVAWVGRTASMVLGLALVLALVVGVASAAFGANGGNFILGQLNKATATTQLNGNVSGKPALHVANPNTANGSRALQLNVAQGKPPVVVNATAGKAPNLNADKLDGKDSSAFASKTSEAWHEVGAPGEPAFHNQGDDINWWANYGGGYNTVGFYKDSQGIVHLKGLVQYTNGNYNLGSSCAGSWPIFTLPAGYRPAATEIRPSLKNNTLTRIDIKADGKVFNCDSRFVTKNDWFLLDGISFRAAN